MQCNTQDIPSFVFFTADIKSVYFPELRVTWGKYCSVYLLMTRLARPSAISPRRHISLLPDQERPELSGVISLIFN